jgi:MarR family transcriptional regulator, organic hydroperoxide resistance regulator
VSSPHAPTAGALLWQVTNRWRTAVDRTLAPLGLTHAQYLLLAPLYGMAGAGDTPTQRELADRSGLEPMYVSRLIRTVERAGLVERTPHPSDTRAVQLALTDDGTEVVGRAIGLVGSLLDELLAPLGGRRGRRTKALTDALSELLTVPLPDKQGDQP